ncbi:hypothetical protein QWJ34_15825 [Saccharibacillus sp. CPCC 101409]|uniref:hypothetical protein n=1 Tax=Saccharibacillus sp. CPCC 101409 TaxID=3058041 RepID=UPI002670F467|nr:hypothetical protein [Saccharibacillus sp. CPCC 101409]MDO3411234.1 hypothetical protein [Saccharibacillus sp. CPCC 101409]
MKFSFEIGYREKHVVEFEFNQIVGNLSIKVDGREEMSDFQTMSFSLVKTYEFEVGYEERHWIKIDKIRKLLLAGFRKTKYEVYVDGTFFKEYEGR